VKDLDTRRDRSDPRRFHAVESADPRLEGHLGSVFTLSNGHLGLRGAHPEAPPWGRPEFYIAGTYAGGPAELLGFHDRDHVLSHPARISPDDLEKVGPHDIATLPNFPFPIAVALTVGGERFSFETAKVLSCERIVEFENALVRRCLVFRDGEGRRTRVDSRRIVSFADRDIIALEYAVTPLDHDAEIDARPFLKTDVTNTNGVVLWRQAGRRRGEMRDALECVTTDGAVRVSIAQEGRVRRRGRRVILEVFAAAGEMPLDEAVRKAEAAAAAGFEAARCAHLDAWRAETSRASIAFDGNWATVQGFNFDRMQLHMAFPYRDNRVGVPIKGLTGHGYRFCCFWDLDFHMFPYFLVTKPRESRLLLEYRYNQLDAYRENARRWGAEGAQVPWETQRDGTEATAPWLCLQEREIHISADAARMFALYDELTPDHEVMVTMGAEFILETARFYASRVKWNDARGRWELPDVGCADQYHTFADNSVFISLMARWNLQYAADLAESGEYGAAREKIALDDTEVARWREILANFHIIGPDERGIIEEFEGYFDLDPDLDGVCELYCSHSQAVKQADILAAFQPFEDLYDEDTRRKNWRFYAARTLHGSSLSHPGLALAAARCGLNDEALYHLHKSTRMDLDDVNMDSGRGLHVSTGAVEWCAVVMGFGGLTPRREYLHFSPNLPRQWRRLSFKVHWRFQLIEVTLTRRKIAFSADGANTGDVVVKVGGAPAISVRPGESRAVRVTGARGAK